jgi:hypothetical protein
MDAMTTNSSNYNQQNNMEVDSVWWDRQPSIGSQDWPGIGAETSPSRDDARNSPVAKGKKKPAVLIRKSGYFAVVF